MSKVVIKEIIDSVVAGGKPIQMIWHGKQSFKVREPVLPCHEQRRQPSESRILLRNSLMFEWNGQDALRKD